MKRRAGSMILLLCALTIIPQIIHSQENTYPTPERLFYIARSLNKNLVCYDANIVNGKLKNKDPLNVYWVNREENPGKTNELSYIQRKMAYGYKLISQGDDTCEVTLSAYPGRKLTICKQDSKYVCLVTINNQTAILQYLYVKAKPNNPLSVEYVELHGIIPGTQKTISERIMK